MLLLMYDSRWKRNTYTRNDLKYIFEYMKSILKDTELHRNDLKNNSAGQLFYQSILDSYPKCFLNIGELNYAYLRWKHEGSLDIFFCKCGNRINKKWSIHCSNLCSQNDPVEIQKRQSSIKETLSKEGITNVFQRNKVKNKLRETKLKKYGNPGYTNLEKGRQTYFNKTGYYSPMSNPDLVIPRLEKRFFSSTEKAWINYLKKQGLLIITTYFIKVDNMRHFVDGYCKETNTVYEFLGNYWHGNPITHPNRENVFNETVERFRRLSKAGYLIKYIWESDYWSNNYLDGRVFNDKLEY